MSEPKSEDGRDGNQPTDQNQELPAELSEVLDSAKASLVSPDELVREVHRLWKEAGGSVAGKNRHSVRYLEDQLKGRAQFVRSLTPKLGGRTKITSADAKRLLNYMLSYWPRYNPRAPENVDYISFLPGKAVESFIEVIVERIDNPDSDGISTVEQDLPGVDVAEVIKSYFYHVDALFTVATRRALVGNPGGELIGFRNLLNDLWSVEEEDGRARALIWVVDRGKMTFDVVAESRQQYLSMQALILRLKALRDFNDRRASERWEWLRSRAVFIVLDVTSDEVSPSTYFKRPAFFVDNILLSNVPWEWAKSSEFGRLYGDNKERIDQRSFSVFFKNAGWEHGKDEAEKMVSSCRYYGYAPFKHDGRSVPRGLELPSPGPDYELAFKAAYAAALERLPLEPIGQSKPSIKGHESEAQLRHFGFRLTSLDEFMNL